MSQRIFLFGTDPEVFIEDALNPGKLVPPAYFRMLY